MSECRTLARDCSGTVISHVKRQANRVGDMLTKKAFSWPNPSFWDSAPPFLRHVVVADVFGA